MELRSCSNLHFILAIRGGLVIKLLNADSQGKPALVFKKLEDVYATADAKGLDSPSTPKSRNRLVFDCDRIKAEGPCLPVVERKTREREPERSQYNCSDSGDEEHSDLDDLNLGHMTLKQLKERCKTKKRKATNFVGLTPKQECTDMQAEEDELDLKEPLSAWKFKLSKKQKAKRKCVSRSGSTFPKIALSLKSEPTLCADNLQSIDELHVPITVKTEVPEPEYSDFQNMSYAEHDFSVSCKEQGGSFEEDSSETLEIVNCELGNMEPISFMRECQRCVLNQVCYDYVIYESTSFLSPVGEKIMEVEKKEDTCQRPSLLPASESREEQYANHSHVSEESSIKTISPALDPNSDMLAEPQSCSNLQEISRPILGEHKVHVSNVEIDCSCSMELGYKGGLCSLEDDATENLSPLENNSFGNPISNFSSCAPNPCLSLDNDFVHVEENSPGEEKQPIKSVVAYSERNCLNSAIQCVVLENESHQAGKEQQPQCVNVEGEKYSSTGNGPSCVVNCTPEIEKSHCTEMWQPPERLLSTRKAISPTSQERLCVAMKSIELYEDTDYYKCKEKLFFEKETENKVSDNERAESSRDPKRPLKVNLTKFTIRPTQILRRPKNNRKFSPPKKGSPPKSSPDNPHPSRSLPHLSTGCTSIQSCSESAIAFSQRQMQDIESLALKLMTELKSMKEIVQEKLLYDAYRNTLKNDTDEVKTVIKNATKAEETARKWLSIMTRDCSRFCKIMKLTENGAAASENVIQKERKKITFADEAGGTLCHVKFLEHGVAETVSEKQEAQSK